MSEGLNTGAPRLVYVEYGTENDATGAKLMSHPEEQELERTRDTVLIDASVANETTQGIVYAYLGVDKHWHFDHHPTKDEIKREHL